MLSLDNGLFLGDAVLKAQRRGIGLETYVRNQ